MAVSLRHYFGIDFGTTNSATVGCMVMEQRPDMVQYGDDEGLPVPSVVAIDENTGKVFTGRKAWEKKMELSQSCEYISSVKTILDDTSWNRTIAGKIWTPVDVACELFKALKAMVSDRTGACMDSATVAIPVGFSALKRNNLKSSKMAGITIKSFITEPTAAFCKL